MKRTAIATSIAAAIAWQTPTLAADEIGKLEVGGVIEIEGYHTNTDGAASEEDLQLSKVEIGAGVQMTEWLGAATTLLWEDDDFSVDSFTFTLSQPEGPWSLTAGKQGVPFGSYETNLVSDPLTLSVGETAENMVWVASYEADALSASAYLYQGSTSESASTDFDHFGVSASYTMGDLTVGLGYVNDISDADGIQDNLTSPTNIDYAAGWTASALYTTGPVTVIAEYITAADDMALTSGAARPSAWNLEAGYNFDLMGKEATAAIAYQGSDEASDLDIAEKRIAAALQVALFENTGLGLEISRDTAYDGTDSTTVTALLSFEF